MEKIIFYSFIGLSMTFLLVLLGIIFVKELNIKESNDSIYQMEDKISPYNRDALIQISDERQLISDELIIKTRDTSLDVLLETIKELDGDIVGKIGRINLYQVRFDKYGKYYIKKKKEKLEENPNIEEVHYNFSFDNIKDIREETHNEDYDWWINAIDLPAAWSIAPTVSCTNVGVIDSFLQRNHTDLNIARDSAFIQTSDSFKSMDDLLTFYLNNNQTHECNSEYCTFCAQKDHGTHVTGIIAARNNGYGITGTNYNSNIKFTTLWQYEIVDGNQLEMYDNTMTLENAILQMVENDCKVINMSFNTSEASSPDEYEADTIACFDSFLTDLEKQEYDFLLVKAAGNNNNDAANYFMNRLFKESECANRHTIIVGAVENKVEGNTSNSKYYTMPDYTNYGNYIDIVAPGSDINSTVYCNAYQVMNGTSMAAPIVSGVASLIYDIHPKFNYAMVKDAICKYTKDCGVKQGKIYPMVNAYTAVNMNITAEESTEEFAEPRETIETEEEKIETKQNSSVDKYVSSFSQIDNEMLNAIKENAQQSVQTAFKKDYTSIYFSAYKSDIYPEISKCSTPKLYAMYFGITPEVNNKVAYYRNILSLVYEIDCVDVSGNQYTYYAEIAYTNGMINYDNTTSFALKTSYNHTWENGGNFQKDYSIIYNYNFTNRKNTYYMEEIPVNE